MQVFLCDLDCEGKCSNCLNDFFQKEMYKLTFSWEFVRKLLLLFLYILKCTTFTSFNAEYTIK